jgi:hypothetical protein
VMIMAITKRGKVLSTCGDIKGGTLRKVLVCDFHVRWVGGAYGGRARFGRRSSSISPSLGGGMRFSGDHTLVGVFHGTTGFEGSTAGGAVDVERVAATWRRHCDCV